MKYRMKIVPIEEEEWYECEADSKEEAIEEGQEYANSNFCYAVEDESVEEIK